MHSNYARLFLFAIAATGCTHEPTEAPPGTNAARAVTAWGEVTNQVTGPLAASAIMAIKGTYGAGCLERKGAWAIALNGYVLTGAETPLTVVASDVGCSLSITEVKAGAPSLTKTFLPASPFPLTASYAGLRSAFLLNGAGETQFYANFRVQPNLSFDGDFVVQMVYSDDVNQTDLSIDANSVVSVGTATASVVAASNATMSLAGMSISVDAKNLVKTATGSATLHQGSIVAESYAVVLDTLGTSPSFAAVDAAYNAPTSTRVVLTGASQAIPAASFGLVGSDLSTAQKRNVIVANIENGITSYQLFQITVKRPSTTTVGAGPAAIDLHTAGTFAMLATSGITIGAGALVTGNVGLSPMGPTGLTGFALVLDSSSTFATSPLVVGMVYTATYKPPTPQKLSLAVADMQNAYADGAGRPKPDGINLGAGELGGLIIIPGLYNWSAAALITTDVTLQGGPNDVWIFQVGGALSVAAAAKVNLVGGARPKNVFWVTVGAVALGASAHLEGIVLTQAAVTTGAGASVSGRVLAQTAQTIAAGSTVTQPTP